MQTSIPIDEQKRLEILRSYSVLDTEAEQSFDDLTLLAAQICQMPSAQISLIDGNRQWNKACYGGMPKEFSRDNSFCSRAIETPDDVLIVEDAAKDTRFADNPFVTGAPFIRFYAGVPLVSPEGFAVGAFNVIDFVPRKLTGEQISALEMLARQAVSQLELRRVAAIRREREIYKKQLNEAQDLFEDFFTHSLALICTHDADGKLLSVNPAAAQILGYAPEQLIGRQITDILSAQAKKLAGDHYFSEIEKYGKSKGLMNVITRRGEERILAYNNIRCTDSSGNFYVLGSAQDVTELKHTETELRKSRQMFELFMNHSPAMIYLKDAGGHYLFTNSPYQEMFNRSADEIDGKTAFDFVPEEIALEATENDQIALATGQTIESVIVTPVADGSEHYLLNFKFPIETETGEKFVGGIAIDITERKQLETDLAAARDAALESARLKSAFLTNVSHEIRTPMNGVLGMTELLLDTPLDRTQKDYAQTIRQSADALLTVINDILDFAKIESGKLRYETIEFDVREVVESTVESLAENAYRKDIEIASLVHADVPRLISGDPGRLRQVLTNLLGNAVKFTEKGGVSLEVGLDNINENRISLCFTITDTGIGISDKDLQNLFQPFVQADNSTTRQFGGTGLGLVISRQIAEMMHGTITVESAVDLGSKFIFTASFDGQTNAKHQTGEHNLPQTVKILAQKHILIADSSEIIRQNLVKYSRNWGLNAAEAASGEEILSELRQAVQRDEPFDYAVIDLNLPDWDGFSLAQRVKTDPLLRQTQIILTTAYGQRGDADQARQIGVAGYLTKPLRGGQLLECLLAVEPELKSEKPAEVSQLVTRHSLREAKFEQSSPHLSFAVEPFRLLVVEDNAINRRVIVEQLKQLGITPEVAVDGEDALEKIAAAEYELVLMDCQMPRLDGYQTTRVIRRLEKARRAQGEIFKPLIIIALTAHSLVGERDKCLSAGMNDYLAKPVKVKELALNLQYWREILNESEDGADHELATLFGGNASQNAADLHVSITPDKNSAAPPAVSGTFSDQEFIAEIIELYLAETVSRLAELNAANQTGDAAAVARCAHAVRGNSLSVGAGAIAETARNIEENAQQNRLESVNSLLEKLNSEFAEFAAQVGK